MDTWSLKTSYIPRTFSGGYLEDLYTFWKPYRSSVYLNSPPVASLDKYPERPIVVLQRSPERREALRVLDPHLEAKGVISHKLPLQASVYRNPESNPVRPNSGLMLRNFSLS